MPLTNRDGYDPCSDSDSRTLIPTAHQLLSTCIERVESEHVSSASFLQLSPRHQPQPQQSLQPLTQSPQVSDSATTPSRASGGVADFSAGVRIDSAGATGSGLRQSRACTRRSRAFAGLPSSAFIGSASAAAAFDLSSSSNLPPLRSSSSQSHSDNGELQIADRPSHLEVDASSKDDASPSARFVQQLTTSFRNLRAQQQEVLVEHQTAAARGIIEDFRMLSVVHALSDTLLVRTATLAITAKADMEAMYSESMRDVRASLLPNRKKRDHPRNARHTLEEWYELHKDASGKAYLTANDKAQLSEQCGLDERQITTWISNKRNRKGSSSASSSVTGAGATPSHAKSNSSNAASARASATASPDVLMHIHPMHHQQQQQQQQQLMGPDGDQFELVTDTLPASATGDVSMPSANVPPTWAPAVVTGTRGIRGKVRRSIVSASGTVTGGTGSTGSTGNR